LRRSLGVVEATLSGVGIILGAGVYTLIGPASALAGNALWLAFVLAGLVALLSAYAYARLGPVRARNAPEFQYAGMAFGTRIGFVADWLMLATNVLAAGAVALGFAGYLNHMTGIPWWAGGALLVLVSGLIAGAGTAPSVWLAGAFTLAEAGGLVFISIAGLPHLPGADLTAMPMGIAGVTAASSLVFFAYIGSGQVGNLAEEMRQPKRDLPRALYLSVVITGVIYVTTAVAAAAVVGWERLSASEAPLALVAGAIFGPGADAALSLVALAATGNTVLLLTISSARSVQAMAADGVLPGPLAVVAGNGVPLRATVIVTAVIGALLLLGSVRAVAELTNGAVLLGMLVVNLSLLKLAWDRGLPESDGQRRTDVVVALLAAASCLALLALAGWASLLTALALAAVALVATWRQRARRLEVAGSPSPPADAAPTTC